MSIRQTNLIPVLLLLIVMFPVQGSESDGKQIAQPGTGLVLSGGGARGAAHIGVEVLEELRVPTD